MKNEGLSRIEGNQAEGEEQNGGEEDGYVAYFSHENTHERIDQNGRRPIIKS
jgi:hypothetical protein